VACGLSDPGPEMDALMGFSENKSRFAGQVWHGTVGQIRRAPELAAIWKTRAIAGQPSLAVLAQQVTDGAAAFIFNIDRLNAAAQDPVKGPLVDAAIAFITNGEFTTLQARTKMGQLRAACVTLRDADKSTDVALIAALDAFALAVPTVPDDIGNETVWT
jgi:hypothetical protein